MLPPWGKSSSSMDSIGDPCKTMPVPTFSKAGILIDKSKIAGIRYADDGMYQMVCTISDSWLFSCAEGRLDEAGKFAPVSEEEPYNHSIRT